MQNFRDARFTTGAGALAGTMQAVNDRLLSVVLECNTEHQDPSRATNQEDSEVATTSHPHIESQPGSQSKKHALSQRQFSLNGGQGPLPAAQAAQLQQRDSENLRQRQAEQQNHKAGADQEDEYAQEMGNPNNALNMVETRGDETPEEKLKYARLQTEGFQDEGYQDSEEEGDVYEMGDDPHAACEEGARYEYEPEGADDSCAYDDEEDFEMAAEGYDLEGAELQADNKEQQPQGQGQGDPQMVDLNNYKGIYFDDENEKFQCPVTGAHFKFEDLCGRMERIRIQRGDPLVEFDSRGNKIYVKSVALAGMAAKAQQLNLQQHGSEPLGTDSSENRSSLTAHKAIEGKRKKANESTTAVKVKPKKLVTQKKPPHGVSAHKVTQSMPPPQPNAKSKQLQAQVQSQQDALLNAVIMQMSDTSQHELQPRNGSETVKITGSILAQQQDQPQAAAVQASRNAKGMISGFEGQHHEGLTAVEASTGSLLASQQLANVLGTSVKESRNKNRIHNPQVTKNSLNGNTLEKLAGSAHKVYKQTLMQPLGRNSTLGAMLNPAQVKSQSSLIESAHKRDAKSKLFGGKKSNQHTQQFSLSKKASGISHPDLLQQSNARNKKAAQAHATSILSGNHTISSNWTQSMLDQQAMSKTQLSAKHTNPKVYQNSNSRGATQPKTSSFQHQRQAQLSSGTTRHLASGDTFEHMKTEHSGLLKHEPPLTGHKGSSNLKVPSTGVRAQNGGVHLLERTGGTVDKLRASHGSKPSQAFSTVGGTQPVALKSVNSNGDSRVQKATAGAGGPGHARKINTLQDNMQFIKEMQKNKSQKSLVAGHHNESGSHQPHSASLKKSGLSSKAHTDSMTQLAGKTLAQSHFQNMSSKIIASQASHHSKKLSKGDNGQMSKFLAGVKGGQVASATHAGGMHGQGGILQSMSNAHDLYSQTRTGKKSGTSGAENARKLIKSTSHLQIGQNGPTESKTTGGKTAHQVVNSGSAVGFKDMQASLHGQGALKTMHKNLSMAQLNQPHLQGSFLNNLQQVSSNLTQQEIVATEPNIESNGGRPDSKLSGKHNRQAQSLSQGKIAAVGGASRSSTQQTAMLQKTLAASKPNHKKQQYLQKAPQQQAQLGPNGFLVNGAGQSLTQRLASSKIVGVDARPNVTNHLSVGGAQAETGLVGPAPKVARKGTEMTILPNESLMHSSQSKIDSHRSQQQHQRSSTNLIQSSSGGHQLSQIGNLQMTASALLHNLTDKSKLQSYQKSVNQVKSNLITGQKDGGLPAKSRNPATQVSLSQKQGAHHLHTLPNSLNPLGATHNVDQLGLGGQSAMTLMFNQTKRVSTKSKDGGLSKLKQNQQAIISPHRAESSAVQQRLAKHNQQSSAASINPEGNSATQRSLYLGGGGAGGQTSTKRVVKRNSNLMVSSQHHHLKTRKSPSTGLDKPGTKLTGSKQGNGYGLPASTGHKKQSASSGNLFVQQAHLMQMKLLESQAMSSSTAAIHKTSVSPKKNDGGGMTGAKTAMFQNLVLPGGAAGHGAHGTSATSVMQGQGTARSQRLSLKMDQMQN